MAAYAALVSVRHIIDQLHLHPRPPISLHEQQLRSLTTNISLLQDFLEGYNSHVDYSNEADELEIRIADAAYAAEDVIEGRILDQILAASRLPSHDQEIISWIEFYQNLERVIKEMDLIIKDVVQINEKREREREGIQDLQHRFSLTPAAGSSRSASTGRNFAMVGVDEMLIKMVDILTSGKSDRQTISITGMGGIGKTALARNIYENQIVVHHFDILAWVTIPQECTTEEILLELVLCLEGSRESMEHMNSEDELGEILYKSLSGRRYLIIIDDLWNAEVWNTLQNFFPNNKNESRIMITTRLANLALQLCGYYSLEVNFLDEKDSWNLLCKIVFGKEACPLELQEIGKIIARNCKGLPLSVVVIGGLLTRINKSREDWEYIATNLRSIVYAEDEERCLQILYMSYNQLPVHLKPCFLYMGVFPEDSEIHASELVKLWVAEGFLKPIGGRSLEEAAREYLKELVDRNLLILHKRSSTGKIKSCKIHDLLRDLCSREADKQKFICFMRHQNAEGRVTQRRICVHQCDSRVPDTVGYVSSARSLIWDSCANSFPNPSSMNHLEYYLKGFSDSLNPRMLRVFKVLDLRFLFLSKEMKHIYFKDSVSKLFNLRYISYPQIGYCFSSSMHRHWNLHTIIARHTTAVAPPEIWNMPLLRHLEFYKISLPDPHHDGFVLANLQTLFTIPLWDCRQKLVERFPNIKKLKICQGQLEGWSVYYLNNLVRLHKLESLEIGFANSFDIPNPSHLDLLSNLIFPHCLKKLTLYGTRLHWEDMTAKIGSLPLLQVLKLKWDSFIGPEWETVEGQFRSLKSLLLYDCRLEYWTTDSTHFPCLQHLQLGFLKELKHIPLGIGEIPTLQSIKLVACSSSAVVSAKNILEDQQQNYGNDILQVQVENFLNYALHIG